MHGSTGFFYYALQYSSPVFHSSTPVHTDTQELKYKINALPDSHCTNWETTMQLESKVHQLGHKYMGSKVHAIVQSLWLVQTTSSLFPFLF